MIKIKNFEEYLYTVSKPIQEFKPKPKIKKPQKLIKHTHEDIVVNDTTTYKFKFKEKIATQSNKYTIKEQIVDEDESIIYNGSQNTVTNEQPQQYTVTISTKYIEELQAINKQLQNIVSLLKNNDDKYLELQTQFATQIAILEEKIKEYSRQNPTSAKKKIIVNRDEFGRITEAHITEDTDTNIINENK